MGKVFKLSSYDICAVVNGKEFTLVWYVDNKKVLNMEAKLLENLINDLKNHFG